MIDKGNPKATSTLKPGVSQLFATLPALILVGQPDNLRVNELR